MLVGCTTTQQALSLLKPRSDAEKALANDAIFVDAIRYKNAGDYEKAIVLFEGLSKQKDQPAPAHFELAKMYAAKNKQDLAITHITEAIALNPKNKWYLNTKIDLCLRYKLVDEAESTFLLRKKHFPKNTDYDLDLADFYIQQKDYKKALKLYEKVEEEIGVTKNVNFNMFLLYRGMDDYEGTENEIKKLIATFPGESDFYIKYADFNFEHGEDSKAFEVYNQALAVNEDDPYILNEVARYFFNQARYDTALVLYKKVVGNPSFDVKEKLNILKRYVRLSQAENDDGSAVTVISIGTAAHPYDPNINYLAAEYFFEKNEFEKAAEYYEVVVDLRPNSYEAWQQLILSYFNAKNFNDMSTVAAEAQTLFPAQPGIYFYSGMALIQQQKYAEAIEVLEEGNDLVLQKQVALKAQFYSSLGDAYHALKQHQKSDDYFDLALELEPKNFFVLNNYAYYLSERKENLTKAQEMSKLSNALNPEEASFQDTYGWILYQLGEYDKALKWLQKAVINSGDKSAVILQHLGDVYQALGDALKAKQYWQRANAIDSSDELLRKIKGE